MGPASETAPATSADFAPAGSQGSAAIAQAGSQEKPLSETLAANAVPEKKDKSDSLSNNAALLQKVQSSAKNYTLALNEVCARLNDTVGVAMLALAQNEKHRDALKTREDGPNQVGNHF